MSIGPADGRSRFEQERPDRSLRGSQPATRRARVRSYLPNDVRRNSRADVSTNRAVEHALPGTAHGLGADFSAWHPSSQHHRKRIRERDRETDKLPAGSCRPKPAWHSGDILDRSPSCLHVKSRRCDECRSLLAVAGTDWPGRDRRPRARRGVCRYRPAGVPRCRDPPGITPDGRSRDGAPVGENLRTRPWPRRSPLPTFGGFRAKHSARRASPA